MSAHAVTAAVWTADPTRAALARTLWDDGVQAADIARRVGAPSKSAVVGYAHRQRWPPRPSPIGRQTEAKPRVPLRPSRKPPAAPKPVLRPKVAPTPRPPALPPAPLPSGCQYPYGDKPDWRWCHAPVEPGRPYCRVHVAVCYVRRASLVAA